MNFSYPLAFALNTYAVTGLLVFCGLTGRIALAADVGIAQSATLALFYAFSANVRNLVLRSPTGSIARPVLLARLALLLPLSLLAYYLSAGLGSAGAAAAAAVILRRGCDWLSEVQLSSGEQSGDAGLARSYVLQQGALLSLLLLAVIFLPAAVPYALFAWALSPLPLAAGFVRRALAGPVSGAGFPWGVLTPNFGSTAMIGVAAYIFRLVLLLLAGKETAGDLYTAFAIGALISSIYAGVIGPTVVLGELRGEKVRAARWLTAAAWLQLTAGAGLFAIYAAGLSWFEATGKSLFFAGAVGASLVGGVLMLQAQKIRLRLLQAEGVNDLFGPDVLMNVAIIGSTLLAYALAGDKAFLYLYLWNSVLALLFYLGAKAEAAGKSCAPDCGRFTVFSAVVALLLAAPVFFQPGHGLFVDPLRQPYFDSLGVFRDLPLPVSILGCFAGAVVFGAWRGTLYSLLTIFLVFSLMFLSVIFSAGGVISGAMQKIMLMVQYILPFFGLVVGQAAARAGGEEKVFRKVFLAVVFAVSTAQLLLTFVHRDGRLTPYLYFFSVYQHLQYVPAIFSAVYVAGLFSLFNERRWRGLLLAMTVTMPLYSILASSMTGLALSLLGPLLFAAVSGRETRKPLAAMAALAVGAAALAFYQFADYSPVRRKFTFLDPRFSTMSLREKLPNINDRLRYWKVYSGAIAADGRTALWGHKAPPARSEFPSAHNYALDFVYNFGVIPFLPLLALLAWTLRALWRRRGELRPDPAFLGLALAAMFLVLVDNSLKVGLRQPYPGILTFFLWGVLLTRLREVPAAPVPASAGQSPANLRLAILNLTGGGISGGYKKYLVKLLPIFERKLTGLKTLCAAPASVKAAEWFAGLQRTEFADCRPFSPLFGARDPGLGGRLNGFSPDVIFAPLERYFSYPGKPFVSMLVNMAPMARNYPAGSLSEKLRHMMQRYHAKKAMVKSDHIIVTSKFVRGFLTSEWGIPVEKISVIYPGADPTEGLTRSKPAALTAKGWDKFFWTIGSLERYRGLEDILTAMQLPGAQDANLAVCASVRPQMKSYARELRAEIERKGLGPRVLWVKGLSEGELAWCYANAEAFIMTSRIEAGPNTALEALAAGAVTIAAENPPLPEFFAGAALYYPPGDSPALAARIGELRAWSVGQREAAAAAAFERSGQFSWEYAADRTLELFGRLARRV